MRKKLGADSFLREGLGIWDPVEIDADPPWNLTVEDWALTAQDVPKPSGLPAFFICVARDLRSATIAVAAMHDGLPHVEISDHEPGTGWLTARVKELREKYPSAVFGAYVAGPVKSWAPQFAEAGVELEMLTYPQAGSACAHLQRLVETKGFTHLPDQIVDDSIVGAERRELDGGSWVWDWRKSTSDPAPIAAMGGALWLLESNQPAEPAFAFS
jgi:hypothetical protein